MLRFLTAHGQALVSESQMAMRGVSAGQIVRDQPGVKEQVAVYLDQLVGPPDGRPRGARYQNARLPGSAAGQVEAPCRWPRAARATLHGRRRSDRGSSGTLR
jgi:hypothetical protein